MKVSESLKNIRNEYNLTVLELSEKINIKFQNIYRWEKGDVLPSLPQLISLADFYSLSLDELIGRDNLQKINIINTLNKAENELLKVFREADERGQAFIYIYANGYVDALKKSIKNKMDSKE